MTIDHKIREVNDKHDPAWPEVELLFTDMYAYMEDHGLLIGLAPHGETRWVESVKKGLGRFGTLFITTAGDEVKGFAYGSIRLMPDYLGSLKIGVITHIHLKEDHRRKGAGEALVRALEKWFAANAVHSVELQVISNNLPAIGFWNRLGYKTELIQCRKIRDDLQL